MLKPTRPFEQIFVFITGFNTIDKGEVIALFTMDAYSEFAFDPVFERKPSNDSDLFFILNKCFSSVLNRYNPLIHPETVTFVTNLPEETEPAIKALIPKNHKLAFNSDATYAAMEPLISHFKNVL